MSTGRSHVMNHFTTQIERIKAKLIKAREVDTSLKAFGARSHRYEIGPPVSTEQILEFESKYSVSLPESYKAFLLNIGNGGHSKNSSAAGPFYGIYPFGKHIGELVYEGAEEALRKESMLSPDMTADEWDALREILEDDDLSEEDYVKELGRIYGGILPLGSQGCTYLHALVLTGKYKGKVVNLDHDNQQPRFTFEDHFLGWYERWLDEVINGELLIDNAGWFGYVIGGTQEHLIGVFTASKTSKQKYNALLGLQRKRMLSNHSLETLYNSLEQSTKENYELILQLMVKYNYKNWRPLLVDYAEVNLLSVFKFLYWYERDNCSAWLDFIIEKETRITSSALFHHYLYLLKACNIDYGQHIKNFVKSEDKRIRISTLSALGKLEHKDNYLDEFISGLQDESDEVIRHTLLALEGVTSARLLPYYKEILERYPEDKHYLYPKLKKCLEAFNVDIKWLKTQKFET